jgi:hypothetical protein
LVEEVVKAMEWEVVVHSVVFVIQGGCRYRIYYNAFMLTGIVSHGRVLAIITLTLPDYSSSTAL